jgi:hypothetical protein
LFVFVIYVYTAFFLHKRERGVDAPSSKRTFSASAKKMDDKRVWVNIFSSQGISIQSKDSLYAYLLSNKQVGPKKSSYKTSANHINVRFRTPAAALKFQHKINWTTALAQCDFKAEEIASIRVSYKKFI